MADPAPRAGRRQRGHRGRPGRAAAVVDACGVAGLLVIGLLVWRTTEYSGFMYDGGMALLSVATALVILAVVHPASRLARVLGAGPLRWLGVRSYGIYLWHYPIIVLTATGGDPAASPLSGVRQVLVAVAVVAVAAVSWALVEDPIRRGRWPRAPRPVARAARDMVAWARGGWPQAATAATMALGIAGVTVTGGIYLAGGLRPAQPAGEVLVGAARPGSSTAAGSAAAGTSAGKAQAAGAAGTTGTAAAGKAAAAPPAPWYGSLGPVVTTAQDAADARLGGPQAAYTAGLPEPLPQTSCQSVIHIGDSTSDGLISSDYLPDPKQRIPARYQQVGVKSVHMEVVGGTSIVEEYDNKPNAYKVAQRYVSQGYKGCWVIALGTNDTADVAVGSNVGLQDRIAKMMSVIGNQPVLWLTVKSRLSSGPYSEKNMQEWDQDLYAAAATHPGMKVYDWASVVQGPWFINDQIHFTSAGYAARGELIADALAAAFPAASTAPASGGTGDNARGALPVFMGGNMSQLPRVASDGTR
ncbi:MAG TPA: acyltransferase family protein [Trebonia sp.]|nr:acyltransferase family protein [Trebonia sp.]